MSQTEKTGAEGPRIRISVTQDTDQVDARSGEKLWGAWFEGDAPEAFRSARTELPLAPFFGANPFEAVGSFLHAFGGCVGLEIVIPESYFSREGEKPVITLIRRKEANSWVACFPAGAKFGSPKSERTVEELFGTNEITTTFTAAAPAEDVLAEIGRLNPGYSVVIGEDSPCAS